MRRPRMDERSFTAFASPRKEETPWTTPRKRAAGFIPAVFEAVVRNYLSQPPRHPGGGWPEIVRHFPRDRCYGASTSATAARRVPNGVGFLLPLARSLGLNASSGKRNPTPSRLHEHYGKPQKGTAHEPNATLCRLACRPLRRHKAQP